MNSDRQDCNKADVDVADNKAEQYHHMCVNNMHVLYMSKIQVYLLLCGGSFILVSLPSKK